MTEKQKTTKQKMKKNQVKVPFPVLLANVLVLIAVLGLSYMWLCSRCDTVGQDIKSKEARLVEANRRLVSEQDRWSTITSPSNLERAIRKYNLAMIMPNEDQVLRIGRWNGSKKTAMNSSSGQ